MIRFHWTDSTSRGTLLITRSNAISPAESRAQEESRENRKIQWSSHSGLVLWRRWIEIWRRVWRARVFWVLLLQWLLFAKIDVLHCNKCNWEVGRVLWSRWIENANWFGEQEFSGPLFFYFSDCYSRELMRLHFQWKRVNAIELQEE